MKTAPLKSAGAKDPVYRPIRLPAAWLSLKNSIIVCSQNCRLQRDWLVEGWVSEHPRNLSLGTRVQSRRLATEPVKGLKIWGRGDFDGRGFSYFSAKIWGGLEGKGLPRCLPPSPFIPAAQSNKLIVFKIWGCHAKRINKTSRYLTFYFGKIFLNCKGNFKSC